MNKVMTKRFDHLRLAVGVCAIVWFGTLTTLSRTDLCSGVKYLCAGWFVVGLTSLYWTVHRLGASIEACNTSEDKPNQASHAPSEPTPGAGSSVHEG